MEAKAAVEEAHREMERVKRELQADLRKLEVGAEGGGGGGGGGEAKRVRGEVKVNRSRCIRARKRPWPMVVWWGPDIVVLYRSRAAGERAGGEHKVALACVRILASVQLPLHSPLPFQHASPLSTPFLLNAQREIERRDEKIRKLELQLRGAYSGINRALRSSKRGGLRDSIRSDADDLSELSEDQNIFELHVTEAQVYVRKRGGGGLGGGGGVLGLGCAGYARVELVVSLGGVDPERAYVLDNTMR